MEHADPIGGRVRFGLRLACAVAMLGLCLVFTRAEAVAQGMGTVTEPHAASAATLSAGAPDPAKPAPVVASAAANPHDLTLRGMILSADVVVKAVMSILGLASIATWTVLLYKIFELGHARRGMRRDIEKIRAAQSLPEAVSSIKQGVSAQLLQACDSEMRLSRGLSGEGIKERASLALSRLELSVARKFAAGTGLLATIGSTGPFVGLFGTVWGIMNSFIGISRANTTNLAVVAPGIAEALLATAIGLVAAIPAVVFYNALVRSIGGYKIMMGDASAQIMILASRDLDRLSRDDAGQSRHRPAAE